MNEKQNLETGSIKKLMLQMAIPALIAQLINLLYNIVDRIYIGHMADVGGLALTGIGLFTPILMLITAFAMLAGSGGAPLAAISMGKGDKDGAEKIIANCFSLLLILSVILTIIFYITAPTLLRMFGASTDTLPYAVEYGRIYILGTIAVLIVMGMNPFLTTQGFAGIFTNDQNLVRYAAWAIRIYMAAIFSCGFQMSCQQAFLALGQTKISLFLAEPIADIIAAAIYIIIPQHRRFAALPHNNPTMVISLVGNII